MADHSTPIEGEEEDLLQSALATAFIPLPTFTKLQPEASPQAAEITTTTTPPSPEVDPSLSPSSVNVESWKSEYESHVQSWRTQSAEAREKAEEKRARWEEIRALEKEQGWSGVTKVDSGVPVLPEPSPADARDLVTSEPEAKVSIHSRQDIGEDSKTSSQKWSDIPSDLTSSYPSLSFPSASHPPSPTHSHRRRQPLITHHDDSQLDTHRSAAPPLSATLAIFDSSLPARTRLGALASSLAINFLLPFVNGVMLGFGEIFAKNIVLGWLGWKMPGSSVANVGVKSTQGRR